MLWTGCFLPNSCLSYCLSCCAPHDRVEGGLDPLRFCSLKLSKLSCTSSLRHRIDICHYFRPGSMTLASSLKILKKFFMGGNGLSVPLLPRKVFGHIDKNTDSMWRLSSASSSLWLTNNVVHLLRQGGMLNVWINSLWESIHCENQFIVIYQHNLYMTNC